jgi:hypothetical protein
MPLVLDSPAPKLPLERFTENEIRYRFLQTINKDRAATLAGIAQEQLTARYELYRRMALNANPENSK